MEMTREEAIKTLKENSCSMCSYGSQNMESCDIRYCDNREAIKALEQQSQNEVIISAKAWDELPAEAKAKMMMALRGTMLRVAACDIGHLPATKCDIPMPEVKPCKEQGDCMRKIADIVDEEE